MLPHINRPYLPLLRAVLYIQARNLPKAWYTKKRITLMVQFPSGTQTLLSQSDKPASTNAHTESVCLFVPHKSAISDTGRTTGRPWSSEHGTCDLLPIISLILKLLASAASSHANNLRCDVVPLSDSPQPVTLFLIFPAECGVKSPPKHAVWSI